MRPVTSKSRLQKGSTAHKQSDSNANEDLGHMAISGKELSTGSSMPKYRGLRMTVDEEEKTDNAAKKHQRAPGLGKVSSAAGLSQPRQRKAARPTTAKDSFGKQPSATTVGFGKGFKATPTGSKSLKKTKEPDLFASG